MPQCSEWQRQPWPRYPGLDECVQLPSDTALGYLICSSNITCPMWIFFFISAPDSTMGCPDSESSNSSPLAGASAKTLASSFFSTLTSNRGGTYSLFGNPPVSSASSTTAFFQAIVTFFFNYCRSLWLAFCPLCLLLSLLPDWCFNIQIIPRTRSVQDPPEAYPFIFWWPSKPSHSLCGFFS